MQLETEKKKYRERPLCSSRIRCRTGMLFGKVQNPDKTVWEIAITSNASNGIPPLQVSPQVTMGYILPKKDQGLFPML